MNHDVASALDILVSGLWFCEVLTLIALPSFWIWRSLKRRSDSRSSSLQWMWGVFVANIALIFLFSGLIAGQARSEFDKFVRGHDVIVIFVDGRPVVQSAQALAALESMHQVMGHHSHPTNEIPVELRSRGDKLPLVLGRDSDRSQEYWVFFPRYRSTASNEIGRITTAAFDSHR